MFVAKRPSTFKRVLLTVLRQRCFSNAYRHRLFDREPLFYRSELFSHLFRRMPSFRLAVTTDLSATTFFVRACPCRSAPHKASSWSCCAPHFRRSPPFRAEVRTCRHDSSVNSPCLFSPLLHHVGIACPPKNLLIPFLLIIICEAANTCLRESGLNSIGLDTHPSLLAQSQGCSSLVDSSGHAVRQVHHLIGRNRDLNFPVVKTTRYRTTIKAVFQKHQTVRKAR